MTIFQWIISYLVPAIMAGILCYKSKSFKRKLIILHVCILTSVLLLIYFNGLLTFKFNIYSLIFFALSSLICIYLEPKLGIVYVLSAIIQEVCIIYAGILLYRSTGIGLAAILSALVFALAHLGTESKTWRFVVPLTFMWGSISILLYYWLNDPVINFDIHILAGGILIYFGLIYQGKEGPKHA